MNMKYWISQAMLIYGGGFVKSLGDAIRQADDDNYAKLQAAFPEYFEKYGEIAKQLKSKDDAKP